MFTRGSLIAKHVLRLHAVRRTLKSAKRLCVCVLFPVPDSQRTATELFQSPLYGSGTVFRSISHLLRHFLFSAVA